MSRMFKVTINDVEQDGEFTAEECGEKTTALLNMMGSVTIDYESVEYNASAKKSQSKPATFSEMVNKQRAKNKGIKKHDLYSDEALEDFYNDQDFYINAYNKIRARTDELLGALDKIINAEEPDEYFNGDDGKQLDLKATAVRDIAQEIIDRVWGNS